MLRPMWCSQAATRSLSHRENGVSKSLQQNGNHKCPIYVQYLTLNVSLNKGMNSWGGHLHLISSWPIVRVTLCPEITRTCYSYCIWESFDQPSRGPAVALRPDLLKLSSVPSSKSCELLLRNFPKNFLKPYKRETKFKHLMMYHGSFNGWGLNMVIFSQWVKFNARDFHSKKAWS